MNKHNFTAAQQIAEAASALQKQGAAHTSKGVTVVPSEETMNKHGSTVEQQITEAVSAFQKQITGHTPTEVTVVLSKDTLVITLHDALTPAEQVLARTAVGAAQIQEFHRQLFATSSESLRQEINRITGRQVREATAEVEPTTGSIVHAFTTGTMVQVYLLAPDTPETNGKATEATIV